MLYTPENSASKYVWQKLIELQGEIDVSAIILGDFKTFFYHKSNNLADRKSVRT